MLLMYLLTTFYGSVNLTLTEATYRGYWSGYLHAISNYRVIINWHVMVKRNFRKGNFVFEVVIEDIL